MEMGKINTTTIEIFKSDLPTIKRWRKTTGLSNAKLINRIIKSSKNRVDFNRFCVENNLKVDNYKRPLSGCEINKSKIFIEKQGRTCG